MTQVEYYDYGLDWAKLKPGQMGNTAVFEIVDFEVICPADKIRFEREEQLIQDRLNSIRKHEAARKKMASRIRRIILNGYMKQFYWLPSLFHGRITLTLLSLFGYCSLDTIEARFGAYLVSLAGSHCLTKSCLS